MPRMHLLPFAAALSMAGPTLAADLGPQSLTLEEVRNAEAAAQSLRGDMAYGKYTTSYISASEFVHDTSGVAPWLVGLGYRTSNPDVAATYRAAVHLPQGAQVCYMTLYYMDTGAQHLTAQWIEMGGYDNTQLPTYTALDSVVSSFTGSPYYGVRQAMMNPQPIGFSSERAPIYYPGCRTINNDIVNRGGKGNGKSYEIAVTFPAMEFGHMVAFKAVDLIWKRQIAPAPATATFNDVPVGHWAFQYVEAVKAAGITSGTTATTFSPTASVSRAEMATFLARALGLYWPD